MEAAVPAALSLALQSGPLGKPGSEHSNEKGEPVENQQ